MDKSIIVLDRDEQGNRLLEQVFQDMYDIVPVNNEKEALGEVAKLNTKLAAIIMDIETTELGGKQLLETLNEKNVSDALPIIVTTDSSNAMTDAAAYGMKACTVIRKPYSVVTIRKQITRMVEMFEQMNMYRNSVSIKEKKLVSQMEIVESIYANVMDGFMTIFEYNNLSTKQHLLRIKSFTRIMGSSYMKFYPSNGLDETKLNSIVRTSVIYDIGMMAIPDHIIHKPSRLTDDERLIMMSHTTKGAEILEQLKGYVVDKQHYDVTYEIVRWHHERCDGKGYPDGLKGDQIPISAQLVGFAEVYDALVSDRIYKKAYDKDTAYKMIVNGECGVFSDEIIHSFEDARRLMEAYADKDDITQLQ